MTSGEQPSSVHERWRSGTPNDDDLRNENTLLWWVVAALGRNPPLLDVVGQDSWTTDNVRNAEWTVEGIGALKYEYREQTGVVEIFVLSNRTTLISPPSLFAVLRPGVEAIEDNQGGRRRYGFRAPLALLRNPEVFQWLVAALRDVLSAPSDRRRLEWVSRLARPEQAAFRRSLLERDGKCVVTGTTVAEVLQAAHIEDHASGGSMSPDNGLLLRVDLHLLFDANLLSFKHEDGRVVVRFHPSLLADPHYVAFEGRAIEALPPALTERLRVRTA